MDTVSREAATRAMVKSSTGPSSSSCMAFSSTILRESRGGRPAAERARPLAGATLLRAAAGFFRAAAFFPVAAFLTGAFFALAALLVAVLPVNEAFPVAFVTAVTSAFRLTVRGARPVSFRVALPSTSVDLDAMVSPIGIRCRAQCWRPLPIGFQYSVGC